MEQIIASFGTVYICVLTILGFVLMGVDKQKAKKRAWRIPERTLILVAFLGGGIGSFLGMYVFRHKTKHTKFVILFPLAAVLSIVFLLKLNHFI